MQINVWRPFVTQVLNPYFDSILNGILNYIYRNDIR